MPIIAVNDLEFIDVALLKKIDAETTVENFGSKISSTFFEAANLLGSLKIKGFVDIHSSIGNSPVTITERGKELLKELDLFAEENIGRIDLAVLGHIKSGVRDPAQVGSILNVNSRDIAYSIYKLWKKRFVDYTIKSGTVEVMLTTQGFEHGQTITQTSTNKPIVEAPPEIKNKVAEELAAHEISISTEPSQITLWQKIVANITYYLQKYGLYILLLVAVILVGIIAIYLYTK